MNFLVLAVFASLVLLAIYIWLNDKRLTRIPPEALAFSPSRCSAEDVRVTAARLASSPPISIADQLPPRTGRKYIVIGGGGFLGGWIISQLLNRGEDPQWIRILDIRLPVREDLKEIPFIQVDVSDPQAVQDAFTASWPDASSDPGPPRELTVFHTAANIRFYERHRSLLPASENVNTLGTKNILNSARSVGASILIYTSSGSVGVRSSRFFLWPWQKEPKHIVQVINDDETYLPKHHDEFFSNYAVTKYHADRSVRAADKTPSGKGTLRTGVVRPGNGVFGPGGDLLCSAYLVRESNPTWIYNTIQSFSYVENCALAHLCYEQRLLELLAGANHPDISGQAFVITDPGPVVSYGDVYTTLETLTRGECTFPEFSPTLMLLLAYVFETYTLARGYLVASGYRLAHKLPPLTGDLVNLQPSLFSLMSVHLIFDDSRARLPPEEGGLGFRGAFTTLEGLHKTYEEHKNGVGRSVRRSDMAGVSFRFRKGKKRLFIKERETETEDN